MENIKANMVAAEPQKSSKKTKIPYYMLLPVAAVLLFMLTINLPDVFNMGAKGIPPWIIGKWLKI